MLVTAGRLGTMPAPRPEDRSATGSVPPVGRHMNRVIVFNPKVAQQAAAVGAARRPGSLKDAVVGFVDNSKLNADRFIERLQSMLQERYGIKVGAKVRKHAPKDALSGVDLAELAKCAAVVQCYGD